MVGLHRFVLEMTVHFGKSQERCGSPYLSSRYHCINDQSFLKRIISIGHQAQEIDVHIHTSLKFDYNESIELSYWTLTYAIHNS